MEISAVVVLAMWTVVVQCLVYLVFPGSFSRGESTIVSHGTFLLFTFNHLLMYRVREFILVTSATGWSSECDIGLLCNRPWFGSHRGRLDHLSLPLFSPLTL